MDHEILRVEGAVVEGPRPAPGLAARLVPAEGEDSGSRTRVLLVDDHRMFRESLRALLGFQPDVEVVGEAGSAAEAVRRAAASRPDVVLLDVLLPDASGIDACATLRQRSPGTAVLMLTAMEDEETLFAAIEAGAAGYLLKHVGTEELLRGIRHVAQGGSFLDPAVTAHLLGSLRGRDGDGGDRLRRLTTTERHILDLVAQGLSNREVAHRLAYAESTVKNYMSKVLAKLEVSRRTQAVAYLTARTAPAPRRERDDRIARFAG